MKGLRPKKHMCDAVLSDPFAARAHGPRAGIDS
jgi:hypothetical protein